MAIVFGKRSGYLLNKGWGILLIVALLMVPIILVSVFSSYITKTGYVGLVAALLLMAVILSVIDGLKKVLNRILNGMEGEWNIVEALEKLPDNYVVLRGLMVKQHLDVDCTVVGPTGVFAIEVKSHKGKIGFDGQELTRNGRRFEKDFLRQATAEASGLRDIIRSQTKIDLYVESIIVFSSKYASTHFGQQKLRNCWVIGREWLNNSIINGSGQTLNNEFMFKIVSALTVDVVDEHKGEKLEKLNNILSQATLNA